MLFQRGQHHWVFPRIWPTPTPSTGRILWATSSSLCLTFEIKNVLCIQFLYMLPLCPHLTITTVLGKPNPSKSNASKSTPSKPTPSKFTPSRPPSNFFLKLFVLYSNIWLLKKIQPIKINVDLFTADPSTFTSKVLNASGFCGWSTEALQSHKVKTNKKISKQTNKQTNKQINGIAREYE